MGEMLERNASLEKIHLWGENPQNNRSSLVVIHFTLEQHMFTHGYGYVCFHCWCVGLQRMVILEMKEPLELQKDWRRILH
jgi:hypothetical protein